MNKKTITFLIIIIVLGLIGFGVWKIYQDLNKPRNNLEVQPATSVDYKKIEKLESLKKPGQPIDVNEPGFGREDPFKPY